MDNNIEKQEVAKKEGHPRVLAWSLIIAIIIVTNLFFNYVISLVYEEPLYENFCPAEIYTKAYETKNQCLENGGMWNEQVVPKDVKESEPVRSEVTGYCNATYTCQKTYDVERKAYNRNVFIILISLGVVVLILGSFVGVSLLSIAFSWSGVLSILIASMRYWSSADNLIRVLILSIALGALIWLAVKKFGK